MTMIASLPPMLAAVDPYPARPGGRLRASAAHRESCRRRHAGDAAQVGPRRGRAEREHGPPEACEVPATREV